MTRIACAACHGTGQLRLGAPYQDTYDRVTTEWQTTDRVFREHAGTVQRTTVCNRLNALARWGLVERRGEARGWNSGSRIEWRRKR